MFTFIYIYIERERRLAAALVDALKCVEAAELAATGMLYMCIYIYIRTHRVNPNRIAARVKELSTESHFLKCIY